MKKVLLLVSAFILAWNAQAEDDAVKAQAPAAVVVSDDEPDDSFGGFGGDDSFGVDPADEIDPSGEGDNLPDDEFGGNDSEGDTGFDVEPGDIDPTGEGDDQPDDEFGGFGGDDDFNVDPGEQSGDEGDGEELDPDYGGNDSEGDTGFDVEPGDIDPEGEGDDQPDDEFGGFGGDDDFNVDPGEQDGDEPDPDYGGNASDEDPYGVDTPDMGLDDANLLFSCGGESVAPEEYGGDEFCAFAGNKVDVEIYDNNKLVIKSWSGVEGYDLLVEFEQGSGIAQYADGALNVGQYQVTNIQPYVDGKPVGNLDPSFGGNASDEDPFEVEPGDIDPTDEGDDQPDTEFGGMGDDPGFNVDPADEPEDGDEPDPDYGGNASDEDQFEVEPGDIDPSGEGDDEPDPDFGGVIDPLDPGFDVDPTQIPDWIATPTGVESCPEAHFIAMASGITVYSENEGTIILYINLPDADGVYEEDSLPRFYIVDYDRNTSGINIVNVSLMESNVIYNLAGQKVGPNYKGFAIVNGKKVLMR